MRTHPVGRVVVGISDTLAGYQALRYAVARARERGVHLVAVHAFSCGAQSAPWREELAEAATAGVRKVFDEALGGLPHGVTIEVTVRPDEPARALVGVANLVDDLLVIGGSATRRRIGHRRAKVARRCSRTAVCPVVIVPPPERSRRSVARLARDVVREADLFLASAGGPPATLPPGAGQDVS